MNKFAKFAILLVTGMALSACGLLNVDDPYVGGSFKRLVKKEQEWSDTIKVLDNWGLKDAYDERLYSHKPENFHFEASGNINEINIDVRIECNEEGGEMVISCLQNFSDGIWEYGPKIVFKRLRGDIMTNSDGYTIRMLDSLKIGKNTYWDVLEFDATSADENTCNFDKFYVAARDGLLRIELQDTIVIERRP